jgi:hypothetical protein
MTNLKVEVFVAPVSIQPYFRLGAHWLKVMGLKQNGERVDLRRREEPDYPYKDLRPCTKHRLNKIGLWVGGGGVVEISRVEETADIVARVRDLATRAELTPLDWEHCWVAIGGDKLYVCDKDHGYWHIRYNIRYNLKTSRFVHLQSSIGNRKRWTGPVFLTAYGRPVIPVREVIRLMDENVGRLSDPYAWTTNGDMRMTIGGKDK